MNNGWEIILHGDTYNSDGTPDMGNVSDGYHTFNDLYEHRSVLFCTVCELLARGALPDINAKPWYSMLHNDGTMYPGMFIAGIETDEGSVTYHFEEHDLYLFEKSSIPYLETAPKWDGNTSEQGLAVLKILLGIM